MADARFSEREVEQIIARAIQLDVPGRAMSLERLREVAQELSISPDALNQALAERGAVSAAHVRSGIPALNAVPAVSALPAVAAPATAPAVSTAITDAAVPAAEPRPWRQWLTAASVAVGTLTGAFTGAGWMQQDGTAELFTMMTGAAAASLLWLHRRSRNGWEMSVQLLVLWSSYGYAFAVAQPASHFDDALEVTAAFGAGSLIVGNVVLFAIRRWSTRGERRARKAAKRARMLEMRAEKATAIAQRAAAALKGEVTPLVAPKHKKRAGVRAMIARLTGSFHTPNPSR